MSSYPIPCYADMQRAVPADSGAGTSSYRVMRTIQWYEISQYFEIRPWQNWFISRFLRRWSLWCSTDSCGQISFIKLWIFAVLSQPICQLNIIFFELADFRQLQISNAETKYYEILPAHTKHLIIQLVKLQIDILKLNTTFWHCKKNSDYFWTRVYIRPQGRSIDKPFSKLILTLSSNAYICNTRVECVKTPEPEQNGTHFAADIFKGIFLNGNYICS